MVRARSGCKWSPINDNSSSTHLLRNPGSARWDGVRRRSAATIFVDQLHADEAPQDEEDREQDAAASNGYPSPRGWALRLVWLQAVHGARPLLFRDLDGLVPRRAGE